MPDISIRDLTMEYSSGGYVVRPFDHFDLELGTGELVLLLGASGCGKTTLLSMLASLLTPTSGTITVGDIEVTSLSGDELTDYRRHTVGVVFQAFNLIPSLTAARTCRSPCATQACRAPPRGPAPRSCSRWSGSTTAWGTSPGCSRAASSSESRSPVRSRSTRR